MPLNVLFKKHSINAKLVFVCVVAFRLVESSSEVDSRSPRRKRYFHFGRMIHECSRHGWWDRMRLLNYGCFCGISNHRGFTSDPIDQCCAQHDACWEKIQPDEKNCGNPGYVTCGKGPMTCQTSEKCEKRTYECDRKFVDCIDHSEFGSNVTGDCARCSNSMNDDGVRLYSSGKGCINQEQDLYLCDLIDVSNCTIYEEPKMVTYSVCL
uniref:phospholipase A2 n=2 Tax=Steinernema glaseri TaxID=37863 RepID=A0A1I7YUL0_9BILA